MKLYKCLGIVIDQIKKCLSRTHSINVVGGMWPYDDWAKGCETEDRLLNKTSLILLNTLLSYKGFLGICSFSMIQGWCGGGALLLVGQKELTIQSKLSTVST